MVVVDTSAVVVELTTISPDGRGAKSTLFAFGAGRMANLTLTIDDETLTKARIRALEEGTTVDAMVCEYLSMYADRETGRRAMDEYLEITASAGASSVPAGPRSTRDELHER